MEYFDGKIEYNEKTKKYGFMGKDGWISDVLKDGDIVIVQIGDKLLRTKVREFESSQYLDPDPFYDLEKLSETPAAFRKYVKSEQQIREEENKINWKSELFIVGFSVISSLIAAVIFFIIIGMSIDFELSEFFYLSIACYTVFGGGMTVGAIFDISIPKMRKMKCSMAFGCGVYYGTIALAIWVFPFFNIEKSPDSFVLAFIITVLVAYIFWLKNYEIK